MRRQTALETCIRIACDADRRHEEPDLAKAMVIQTVAGEFERRKNAKRYLPQDYY